LIPEDAAVVVWVLFALGIVGAYFIIWLSDVAAKF